MDIGCKCHGRTADANFSPSAWIHVFISTYTARISGARLLASDIIEHNFSGEEPRALNVAAVTFIFSRETWFTNLLDRSQEPCRLIDMSFRFLAFDAFSSIRASPTRSHERPNSLHCYMFLLRNARSLVLSASLSREKNPFGTSPKSFESPRPMYHRWLNPTGLALLFAL